MSGAKIFPSLACINKIADNTLEIEARIPLRQKPTMENHWLGVLLEPLHVDNWISGTPYEHWKKWSHFDLKSWVTGGTKIQPGITSNWRMFESNWLEIENQNDNSTLNSESIWISISSQFDSNILQLLGIPGRILVPPVTQLVRLKWLDFFFLWGTQHLFYGQAEQASISCTTSYGNSNWNDN